MMNKNKSFKFSIILKIMFLFFELILVGNAIYSFNKEIYISIGCIIVFILIFIFENCFYSYISFKDEIIILNKFKVKKIKYQEIKKIEIFKSISQAVLVGADIDIKIIYKNNDIRKIHLGTIIKYNILINTVKEIARYKCIKFKVYE